MNFTIAKQSDGSYVLQFTNGGVRCVVALPADDYNRLIGLLLDAKAAT